MQLQLGLGILSFYVVAATPGLAGHWTAPPAPTAELTSPATTPAPSGAEKRGFFLPLLILQLLEKLASDRNLGEFRGE